MDSIPKTTRFLRQFLAVSLCGLLSIALLNLVVDPYGRFGLNRLGVFVSASREVKLQQATRQPHDALLIGNSRTAMIPAAEVRGGHFFNAGIDAASLQDVLLFLERRLRPNELVVLNLDHIILRPVTDNAPAIAFAPLNSSTLGSYLLSMDALNCSGRTLSRAFAGAEANYDQDGTTRAGRWRREHAAADPELQRSETLVKSNFAANFRLNPHRLEELEQIRRLVQKRGGRLVVFFSPVHEDVLPALESGRAGEEWARTVRAIRALFPESVDLTRSAYSGRTNFFATDLSHFFPEVGVRMLNETVLPAANSH